MQAAALPARQAAHHVARHRIGEQELPQEAHRVLLVHGPHLAHFLDQGLAGVQRLVLLGVIADAHAGADHDLARRRLLLAQDAAQEHALACTVRPQQTHPLAVPDQQVQLGQEHLLTFPAVFGCKSLVQVDDLEHLVRAAPAVQRQAHLAPLQRRLFHPVHALQHLATAARLAGVPLVDHLAGPQLKAGDRGLDARDLFLLRLVQLLLAELAHLFFHRVRGIVALVDCQPVVLDLGDLGHCLIEQIAVVGDKDQRSRKGPDQA